MMGNKDRDREEEDGGEEADIQRGNSGGTKSLKGIAATFATWYDVTLLPHLLQKIVSKT